MDRGFTQTGKLYRDVACLLLPPVRLRGIKIASFVLCDDLRAAIGCVDPYKSRGLTVADGRREGCRGHELLDDFVGDRVRTESPNVAPPREELCQLRAKFVVESQGRTGVPSRRVRSL